MPKLFVKRLLFASGYPSLQQRWEEHSVISLLLHTCQSWMEQQGGQTTQRKVTETLLSHRLIGNAPHKEILIRGITIPIALYSHKHISAVLMGSNWQEGTMDIHNQQGPEKDTQGWFYSHLLTEDGWVRTKEAKRKMKTRWQLLCRKARLVSMSHWNNIPMVQKWRCVTTFGVSFLQLQLRKSAAEPQNMLGSQQGLALHTRQPAGTQPTADYV